jgi:PilZ domain-containing protein
VAGSGPKSLRIGTSVGVVPPHAAKDPIRMVKRMKTPAAYRRGNGTLIETVAAPPLHVNSERIPKAVGSERRTTERFPIELPAELCIREIRIPGTTVNISSGGLLMKCSHDSVKIGKRVKVRITNWPNSRGKNSDVALIMEGAVVRDSTGYLAVRRTRYAFVED